MDSIYTQCSNAARRLAEGTEPFTESDVVLAAGTSEWTEADFIEADKHAPQVLATLYRGSKVVRFGTVDPEVAPLTGEPDYVRRGGSLLYANLRVWTQPERTLETPNGSFAPVMYASDSLFKNGRRRVTERDDFTPWADQALAPDERPDVAALRRENQKLRAALVASQADVKRLTAETERLREQAAERAALRSR